MSTVAYTMLFLVSLLVLLHQLRIRQKQLVHLLFGAFCGSIAIMTTEKLGGNALGVYSSVLGMGACMTCNAFWLISRVLFRQAPAVTTVHFFAAGLVAFLIVIRQGADLAAGLSVIHGDALDRIHSISGELLVLLSSTMLVLTLWEACREFSQHQGPQRQHRVFFLSAYGLALLVCTLLPAAFPANEVLKDLLQAFAATSIIIATQILIHLRFDKCEPAANSETVDTKGSPMSADDQRLANDIHRALFEDKIYLQPNLKVGDLAKRLDVPEYRVSRVLRHQFEAKNFNQLINTLRIEKAKELLASPETTTWPLLVIGLESGFASDRPFVRAFKASLDCTPSEYRHHLSLSTQLEANTQPK